MKPNYQDSKIFEIVSPSGKCYIGITVLSLRRRLNALKAEYRMFLKGNKVFQPYFELFEEDEKEVQIFLIEAYPCNNKDELFGRQTYYVIRRDCINKKPYNYLERIELGKNQ